MPPRRGTNGIQALDLLGRKVQMQNGRGLQLLCRTMRDDADAAAAVGDEELSRRAAALRDAVQRLESVTASLLALGSPAKTLANAHEYLNMTGHTVMAWMLLRNEAEAARQLAAAAAMGQDAFLQGKRFSSRFFFAHELPKTVQLAELLVSADATTTEMGIEMF